MADRDLTPAVTDADREAFLAYVRKLMVGIPPNGKGYDSSFRECERKVAKSLDALIARARAEEREACAKHVIDSRSCNVGHSFQPSQCEECYWFDSIAAAIRARSEGGKA